MRGRLVFFALVLGVCLSLCTEAASKAADDNWPAAGQPLWHAGGVGDGPQRVEMMQEEDGGGGEGSMTRQSAESVERERVEPLYKDDEEWSWNIANLSTLEKAMAGVVVAAFSVFGLFECFYGFRFVHIVISLYGLIYGFTFTYLFIVNVIASSRTAVWIAIGVGSGIGLILAVMAWVWYLAGVFILGGGLGIFLAFVIQQAFFVLLISDNTLSTVLFWVMLPVLFVVAGAISLCNQKLMVVIGSSTSGAVLFIGGLHFSFVELMVTDQPDWTAYLVYLRIFLIILISAVGATVQYLVTSRKHEDDYSPLEM